MRISINHKEGTMKKKLLGFAALGFLLIAFVLALAPVVRAQGVNDKIQALENELGRLKSEQMELKKEAVAAAAAMPSFSYRPGGGVNIEAADQSWAINFGYEFAQDMMWLEGSNARREGDFGIFRRRNRPQIYHYWDKGFYEFKYELDLDGDETGGKDGLNQRSSFLVHFEQMNPWFPTLQTGSDVSGAGTKYRSSDLTFELPQLDRNNNFNTGSYTGIGLLWENLPALGLPGNQQFHYNWVIHGMGRSDGLKDQSNKHDHLLFYNINPFAESKNKWINGIGYSMMAWFGNIDDRNATNTGQSLQLRTQEGSTRLVLFTSPTQARGFHTFLSPSVQYKVGPYQLRFVTGFDRYNVGQNLDSAFEPGGSKQAGGGVVGKVQGTYWKFMNDVMVWSPKGLFTGSSTTPGTLGMGYSYEQTWVDCGSAGCDTANVGQVSRNKIIVNELDFRYWIRPSLSLWLAVKFHDVANTPAAAQTALRCSGNQAAAVANPGKSCDFVDTVLRLYWIF